MTTPLWKAAALFAAGPCLSAYGQQDPSHFHGHLVLSGGDVSAAADEERQGVVFKDHGQPEDIFKIFKDHGATCIRLRLFVNPHGRGGTFNDLPYTIALAKRVKAAGLLFSLDLHYSDTWADPQHQITPAAWQQLAFPQLVDQVRTYTEQTLQAFQAAGVTPDVVQIGNEITHGLLWPLGHVDPNGANQDVQFDHVAALLKAGIEGVHLALGKDTPTKILIHIDGADATKTALWFFDNITRRQVPFDMIGFSYYPFSSDKLSTVKRTFQLVATKYGKPMIIAETGYPFVDSPLWKGQHRSFAFPLTPEGQKQYLQTLIEIVHDAPNGLGAGVLYWFPESVPAPGASGWHTWNGGDAAMFDHNGNALPSFEAFGS